MSARCIRSSSIESVQRVGSRFKESGVGSGSQSRVILFQCSIILAYLYVGIVVVSLLSRMYQVCKNVRDFLVRKTSPHKEEITLYLIFYTLLT